MIDYNHRNHRLNGMDELVRPPALILDQYFACNCDQVGSQVVNAIHGVFRKGYFSSIYNLKNLNM